MVGAATCRAFGHVTQADPTPQMYILHKGKLPSTNILTTFSHSFVQISMCFHMTNHKSPEDNIYFFDLIFLLFLISFNLAIKISHDYSMSHRFFPPTTILCG